MNMVELMLGISLLTIVLSGLTHAVPILQKNIYEGRTLREEIAQVEQVLQIITRSIHQSGFENIIKSQSQSTRSQKVPLLGIQVFQQATLTTDKVGKISSPQSYLAGRRQTDAMLIQHETYGHFDCVGRKITDKRVHQGLSRIGFFVQFKGNKSNAVGTLMCQSLTNKGQAQNDAILTGVEDFLIYLEDDVVIIELTMQSTRQYQTSIALQNQISM
jgi:type II secretory pathway component PulJ